MVGLLIILALIALNSFFVATEFALVSVRRTRLDELLAHKRPGAAALDRAVRNLDRTIATTQLGITLASLGLGWAGEPALAGLFDPLVALFPLPPDFYNISAHGLSAALAFVAITFLTVVLGELTPKAIALQRAEQVGLLVAEPMSWMAALFKPGVWLLTGTGNRVLRLLGFEPAAGREMVHSVEEIKLVMAASADQGVLQQAEYGMVDSILDLREMNVRQLMVPRTDLVALPHDARLRDAVTLHQKNPHGKFPVYEGDIDHVVGVLYIRDVIGALARGKADAPARRYAREAVFLPETARIDAALAAFRAARQHLAMVLDEYGGTAGLITLEDILEQIAGEMPDHFDRQERPDIVPRPGGVWEVSGQTLIEDVNQALGIQIADENYDTIGGHVMGRLERIARAGDEVIDGRAIFQVDKVDGLRIDRLRIKVQRPDS